MKQTRSLGLLLLIMLMSFIPAHVFADEASKPFAEQRIVLQISDPHPFKQTLVLNVASNLLKHYGQDKVDIEIVAFGPGLRLLFSDNSNSGRVNKLSGAGVQFSACSNTIKNMGKKLGADPVLHNNSVVVSAGVVRIIELQDQGYKLIKP